MLLLRTDRALISAMSSSLGSGAPSLNLIARSVRALKWWSVPCSRQPAASAMSAAGLR
jgi:hypothetical protein